VVVAVILGNESDMDFSRQSCPWCGRFILMLENEYVKDKFFFQKTIFFCPHCRGRIKFKRHATSILFGVVFCISVIFLLIYILSFYDIHRVVLVFVVMAFCFLSVVSTVWFGFRIGVLAYLKDEC
jgi:hypothetical protein